MSSPVDADPGLRPRLLVFSDDWGRHPSSCQHLVRHLLPQYDVAWVDTIGMRTPSFNWETVSRGVEKVAHWMRPPPAAAKDVPAHLTVLRPKMWPWFTHDWDRFLNRRLLLPQLARWCRSHPVPVTAITTLPIVADLMGSLPVHRWVYYCVDDFSEWPGVDQRTMLTMERTVIERADAIVSASRHLQQRIALLGRSSELLMHGVDLEFWQQTDDSRLPSDMPAMEQPLIVFWGLVDRRLDLEFLRRLSESLQQGTILLVGPENDPDPALMAIPRVRRWPSQPLEVLPAIGQAAAVLIMPYADLPVTQAMQPLKMLEYLATGRPVVVRKLPATNDWADGLDAVSSPDEFVTAVQNRLDSGVPASQAAGRLRLAQESWAVKAVQFEHSLRAAPDYTP